jgi:membrane-associated phospholipid phosphatase
LARAQPSRSRPVSQWIGVALDEIAATSAIALELVRAHALDTAAAARVFAVLNTAEADAFICIWMRSTLRPVTAIRRESDLVSSPLITTPPFPSYVSGHSAASGAATTVLSAFFPADAAGLGGGGGGLASLRGHPLPHRRLGRARIRDLRSATRRSQTL